MLMLFGTGFGPTTPSTPIGQLFSTANPTASTVTTTILQQPATVQFAGEIAPGLYQFNVVVPDLSDYVKQRGISGAFAADVTLRVGGLVTQPSAGIMVK
jgi:uncharacterized protein (TIGR03437 family)